MTVSELYRMGRLAPVDAARVAAFLGLAEACDAKPHAAALWRVYGEAEERLRTVGDTDDDLDATVAFLRFVDGDDAAPPFGGA